MKRIFLTSTVLAAAFAGPLAAQEICAGIGAGGQWVGGTEDASDITTADAYREQMALVLGGNAYVSLFTVSDTTDVRIEAAGRGAGDPLIEIFDEAGSIVASDDDSGGNGAARSEISLDAGRYCMSMKSYENAPMTAFVRIGRTEQDALTTGTSDSDTNTDLPAGSCAQARAMGEIGTTMTASVDETAFWTFTLTAPTSVSITATNEDADPAITLLNINEITIAENDDTNGLNAQIDRMDALPSGDYCIAVRALNDTSLPIDITVSVYDPVAALAGLYARGEAAPPLDGSVDVTALGALQSSLRQDAQVAGVTKWFSFDIDQAGLLLVEAIAVGDGDPWLIIYDDLGREIARNDDHDDLNSQITARVQPGSYIAGVRQAGSQGPGFVRLVFERYVPAQ